ncbi:hypothetical protein BDZ89DRAFT_643566 [Hymenopellis radicata]|nr:hypothetical protein BDZ89DRAFT_643566 [Hymenopellis radicata]
MPSIVALALTGRAGAPRSIKADDKREHLRGAAAGRGTLGLGDGDLGGLDGWSKRGVRRTAMVSTNCVHDQCSLILGLRRQIQRLLYAVISSSGSCQIEVIHLITQTTSVMPLTTGTVTVRAPQLFR